ncbi:thiamine phosphate synthase [Paenimyroides baculatum]|uniref:Thiamine phosphate synthase n=1 Tax=Paenimyroides baculatum TaxID=2608000 RepID=A0A5M6CC79_9FLAO|nr:thiamine phosphate synthase [Paenimyroides baculatum]KAA5532080.1 thiamine phosphate synthase [Paenimyroides baculatum]
MILIISPEEPATDETACVNSFFENGLDLFHVRKYAFSDDEMQNYLNAVDQKFRNQIVLHSHFHLAKELGIHRLHLREVERERKSYLPFTNYTLSTSVHSIDDFNALDNIWQYAFLSPVFSSISKSGYGRDNTVLNELKRKNNPSVQLIGLGGIHKENCQQVLKNGADGISLLGSIWRSHDPLNTFLLCRKIVQLY